jgi:hypothetical protein
VNKKRGVASPAQRDADRFDGEVPPWLRRRRLKRAFLDVYSRQSNPARAAEAVGISERQVHRWKQSDPWFARRCEDALALADDRLIGELFRLAIDQKNMRAIFFILRQRDPDYQPKKTPPVVPLVEPRRTR